MTVRNIKKSLVAMEDIAQGKGVVSQTRAGNAVDVQLVDIPLALDTTVEMSALDVTKYTRARVYSDTVNYTDYIYDAASLLGIVSDTGPGTWLLANEDKLELALINDLSQAYGFKTLGLMINSNILFLDDKVLTVGNSSYLVAAAGAVTLPDLTLADGKRALFIVSDKKFSALTIAAMQANLNLNTGDTVSVAGGLAANDNLAADYVITASITDIALANGLYADIITKNESYNAVSSTLQKIYANLYLQNNYGQSIVNIGDSISHGAYSGNAYTNHWTSLLQRSINAQFGSKNLGTIPMTAVYNSIPSLNTDQIHDVTFSAGWGSISADPSPYDYPIGNQGAAASNILGGRSFSSSTISSTITIVVPVINDRMSFMYTQQVGGGTFTTTINGVAAASIDTSGALSYNVDSNPFTLIDDGTGLCTVVLTKADALPTEINSVLNYSTGLNSIVDLTERVSLRNYSQSGRQLLHMTEGNIIRACNSACLIVSLGFNDWDPSGGNTDASDANFNLFKQRVDWIILYCKVVYKNAVVVNDFIWYATLEDSRTKQQLQRIATECNGVYINYAESFFSDKSLPDIGAGPHNLNTPLFLWADAAHPNPKGNEIILARVADALELSVKSKTQALNYHDYPYPLSIATGYENKTKTLGFLSTVTRNGLALDVKVSIKPNAGDLLTTLEILTNSLPVKFGDTRNVPSNIFSSAINLATGTVDNGFLCENNLIIRNQARVAGVPVLEKWFSIS